MKAVKGGKLYDTDKAVELFKLRCRAERGDFAWHSTHCYMTSRGRYFLCGHGGASSMWRRDLGSVWGLGEGIRPITKEEAQEHAEEAGMTPEEMIAAGFTVEEA